MKRTLFVIGTRPEAIKICPIIKEFKNRKEENALLLTTGQHKEMLYRALNDFGVAADFSLEVMRDGQTLGELTERLLFELRRAFEDIEPERVVVHGDTVTALCAAMTAFHKGIEIAHVEAGLRSGDVKEPFPEEFDRRVIALVASLHFAPTGIARRALISEGVRKDRIFVTGNTVTDALMLTQNHSFDLRFGLPERFAILTVHRRENLPCIKEIFTAILESSAISGIGILYPVHKNPLISECAASVFCGASGIVMTEPLSVSEFHFLMRKCAFVITDSGGVQEEASFLGKTIILLRNNTERKELLTYRGLIITGTNPNAIKKAIIFNARREKKKRLRHKNKSTGASAKIADILTEY